MREVIALLLMGLVQNGRAQDLLVETTQGLVRGIRADDGDYSMFLGIPYGVVDAENPFGASTPHPNFETIFEANDDSVMCAQMRLGGIYAGSKDCLQLHVYVPNNPSSDKLAVMVWIHGGAFSFGNGNRISHGPKFFMRHDVIVVMMNYRVGPYGFMCLDTAEVPGNQGLKDQTLALRWINRNIAAFGGDPDRITIFGESAGSGSVDYHLYSNYERLYQQAIMQSGSAMGPSFIQESDPVLPITIAANLGYQTNNVSEALAFLANVDESELIPASWHLDLRYRPCVEKKFDGVESFITNHPYNLDLPKVRNMSILSGFAEIEELGDFANRPDSYYENLNVFNNMLTESFIYNEEFEDMEDLMRRYYIGDEKSSQETRLQMCHFQSDFKFNYPMQKSIMKYIENGADKVYQYMFSYDGGRNLMKIRMNVNEPGTIHSDLLGYEFDVEDLTDTPSAEDQLIMDRITTMWTNFAKYGDPTPETTDLLPIHWPTVTDGSVNYLNIDTEMTTDRSPYYDRLTFWELFYKRNDGRLKATLDH